MRVLVAGLGNVLKGDDGFGVRAVAAFSRIAPAEVTVIETGIGGIHLVQELMRGYDGLVLFDAVDRGLEPGQITVVEPVLPDLDSLTATERRDYFSETHYATPIRALTLAREVGVLPATRPHRRVPGGRCRGVRARPAPGRRGRLAAGGADRPRAGFRAAAGRAGRLRRVSGLDVDPGLLKWGRRLAPRRQPREGRHVILGDQARMDAANEGEADRGRDVRLPHAAIHQPVAPAELPIEGEKTPPGKMAQAVKPLGQLPVGRTPLLAVGGHSPLDGADRQHQHEHGPLALEAGRRHQRSFGPGALVEMIEHGGAVDQGLPRGENHDGHPPDGTVARDLVHVGEGREDVTPVGNPEMPKRHRDAPDEGRQISPDQKNFVGGGFSHLQLLQLRRAAEGAFMPLRLQ